MEPKIINIEPLSPASLFVELFFNDVLLAKATSFMVKRKNNFYLLTNRHNVTGKDQITGELLNKKTGAIPNKMRVHFNLKGTLGVLSQKSLKMQNEFILDELRPPIHRIVQK